MMIVPHLPYRLIVAGVLALAASLSAAPKPHHYPVNFHSRKYGLTFVLPTDWKGYHVRIERWNGYSSKEGSHAIITRGPTIIFENPHATAKNNYQNIPILVFTRKQWRENEQAESRYQAAQGFYMYAGGLINELAHNHRYVFATWGRFNRGEAKGWQEVDAILAYNEHLHPHPLP